MPRETRRQSQNLLPETLRELNEVTQTLEAVEFTALSDVAVMLAEAAESLSRTAKDLADIHPTEWMTASQAAKYLGCESVKSFKKIASREGIPKHFLSARTPRYNRVELDTWLMRRQEGPHR